MATEYVSSVEFHGQKFDLMKDDYRGLFFCQLGEKRLYVDPEEGISREDELLGLLDEMYHTGELQKLITIA